MNSRIKIVGISLFGFFIILGLILNIFAAYQATNFTHFIDPNKKVSVLDENSSFEKKLSSVLFGIQIPKPKNAKVDLDFVEVDTVIADVNLEVWRFDMEPSKGIVALFHGYKSTKSALWREAQSFYRMGYSVVLVDFRASGNSDGMVCTIGYNEANDVVNVYNWIQVQYPNQPIYLYGISMGAAAVLRAVSVLDIHPNAIMVQSSFSTMNGATKNRFRLLGLPSWPMANLLTFWGGYVNDFDAFKLNPSEFAKQITTPTLVIHGVLDNRVSWEDSETIYDNLQGPKEFGVFSKSGHESMLNKEEANWVYLVTNFLESAKK